MQKSSAACRVCQSRSSMPALGVLPPAGLRTRRARAPPGGGLPACRRTRRGPRERGRVADRAECGDGGFADEGIVVCSCGATRRPDDARVVLGCSRARTPRLRPRGVRRRRAGEQDAGRRGPRGPGRARPRAGERSGPDRRAATRQAGGRRRGAACTSAPSATERRAVGIRGDEPFELPLFVRGGRARWPRIAAAAARSIGDVAVTATDASEWPRAVQPPKFRSARAPCRPRWR